MLKTVEKKEVKLLPSIFKERFDLNRNYLMELKNHSLLQNFYLEAGLIIPGFQVLHDPDTEEIHWGWDAPTCQLRGHFLGHWLSAAAATVVSENDYELKAKMDVIIDELKRCQELNGGEWIGSIPEKYFDKLEKSQHVWSPQYVMHKTIMGLLDAHMLTNNQQALQILDKLSDWYVRWTSKMQSTPVNAVYRGEEAGMLEVWATLYEITGLDKYYELAQRYSNPRLYDDLLTGKDALTNYHANASIPWAHGAARLYEVTGDEQWRRITEAFWKNAVTDRGFYCTGGQNAGEYWTQPFKLGHFLSNKNQEFCTVYNMIRLADYLYRWTGDTMYADYIERNLYNGFLAQQNMYTGMPTYFLPLAPGSTKKWGTKTRDFWCCHGTMVQAQTLYNSLIYYQKKDSLAIAQYIPSEMNLEYNGMKMNIVQTIDMKYYNNLALFDEKDESQMSRWLLKFQIKADEAFDYTISFRIPKWIKAKPVLTVNDEAVELPIVDGYVHIHRIWFEDEVKLYLPSGVRTYALEDIRDTYAFVEGPIVLAGLCDGDKTLYVDKNKAEEYLTPQYEHTYSIFPWKQGVYKTVNQTNNINFIPLYEVTDEKYTVYFNLLNPNQ